jgi:hypothetical protein
MSWVSGKKTKPSFLNEPVTDSELSPVICCDCGTCYTGELIEIPEICAECGAIIDLETQFAFSRAVDAFDYGQEILMRLSPKTRRRNPFSNQELEAVQYYQQSYSSFFKAFEGTLAESQRRMAIEIMASIAFIQLQHQVISTIEGAYWQNLLKELTMQKEVIDVEEKIRNLSGPFRSLLHLRWKLRLNQLKAALVEIDRTIERIEELISFVQPPGVRRTELPMLENE